MVEPRIEIGPDGLGRCWWGLSPPEYTAYHDDEWGRPVDDDRRLFEKLILEGFQSGLSWLTILRKREALENVLVPYRADENIELFRHNGFQIVETFFQWYNFCGFLCVKSGQD